MSNNGRSPSPILEIRDLTVKLPPGGDRTNAVENISLHVNAGETVCVVGESGSGKSVTAQTVIGLLPRDQLTPTSGQVMFEGDNVLTLSRERMRELRGKRISMIFQEPMTALNPVVTVGQQIAEVFRSHDLEPGRNGHPTIVDLLKSVRLPEPDRLQKSFPHQLSGGQRQRIMIAMALALSPSLLLADEPTTALDVTTQSRILKLIREMQEKYHNGVMFITHDFGVVAEIADRVVVMRHGQIVEQGTTEEILRRPRHDYTRMLISAVPSMVPRERPHPAQAPIALRTENLAKTYGGDAWFRKGREVKAAVGVNLELRRGETLGIVGESGSGKSTVARCVVRLIDPSGGKVFLGDTEIGNITLRQLKPLRKRIQIIFQDPYRSLNPRRSIGKSLIEGPMNFGVPEKEAWERAKRLLEMVGIDPEAHARFPHQFSGGQRQRICIARALAMEPEVLVADEAVSALDVSVQAQVLDLLTEIRDRFNLAVLFITHDLRVAAQVCDAVAVMYQGEVVEYDRVDKLFVRPAHTYTRELLAAAPGRHWNFQAFSEAAESVSEIGS
jgi:peptide/nickel transport system ATP-binding protein